MAMQLNDKRMLFDYAVKQLQHFLIECGRTSHTILQSDQNQEGFLAALITSVANRTGNITTRNSGAYSSQSQGGVERAHRTLFAQQIRQNYNRNISMKHPRMPWIVRHSAYIMNTYAAHGNGCTSCFNRWNREQHTPLCEFGETAQHMLPTAKQFPKLEPRLYHGIWLGKDTTTGKSLIGIYNKIGRARTIRRQIMPHKYTQQPLDCVRAQVQGRHPHQHCLHQLSPHQRQCQQQSKHLHHRKMQQPASEGKRQSASAVESSKTKAEEESRTNITNGYITNTSEATSIACATRTARIHKSSFWQGKLAVLARDLANQR